MAKPSLTKLSLTATVAAVALIAGACSDMTASDNGGQQAQAAKDTPFYTPMPANAQNQNPNLSQAPSPMTDEGDPNNTPINP